MSPEERIAQIQRTFIEMDTELQQAGSEIVRLEGIIQDLIRIADDVISESEPYDTAASRDKYYKAVSDFELVKRCI